jgi:hypothetical protein
MNKGFEPFIETKFSLSSLGRSFSHHNECASNRQALFPLYHSKYYHSLRTTSIKFYSQGLDQDSVYITYLVLLRLS